MEYESDDFYALSLDIVGDGVETEKDILVDGIALKAGQEIFVKGKGYAGRGFVVSVAGGENPVEVTTPAVGDKEIRYTACVEDIRQFTAESLHVGDHFYDVTTGADLGEITAVETAPYYEEMPDAEGNLVRAVKPRKYRADLTLTGRCTETENSYFLDGTYELKVGSKLPCATKYVESEFEFTGILPESGN